jgi:lysine 2,3-aminomutase
LVKGLRGVWELFAKSWAKYIAEHKEITNVIISGGDPMMLPTKVIAKMLEALKDIDHVNYVRIGTRTPVVYPLRYFDDELIEVLRNFNQQKALYIPTHFNHANEITDLSKEAVMRIRNAGITINNQAVFLKGVNDTVQDLEDLMNGLIRIGVNPPTTCISACPFRACVTTFRCL